MDYAFPFGLANPASMGVVVEPESPLMQGVTSFGATAALRSFGSITAGAVVVAKWTGGQTLVVRGTRGSRTLVELNFNPVSTAWIAGGDGAVLLRNALKYSTCKPAAAVCPPGTYATAGFYEEGWPARGSGAEGLS